MLKLPENSHFHSISQFTFVQEKALGHGSFGIVKLAIHNTTLHPYAIKIINLKDIPSQIQLKLIEREINLHSIFDHPHIIKLWDTILEGDSLYMILEYAEQGNLFYHQNNRTYFTEPQAFRFFSQVVKGIRHMHQHNILHRDIKPENLLLDHNCNIKICDLGWSADNLHSKRTTFCGTYQYMAPQMIFNKSYDYRVDIWALGILLYELLHGVAPFKGESLQTVKQNMIVGEYALDKILSSSVKDLIKKIIQFDPEERCSLEVIVNHPWMTTMQKIINKFLTNSDMLVNPKYLHLKISQIPSETIRKAFGGISNESKRENEHSNFHKKTSSAECKDAQNININFSINNYSLPKKKYPVMINHSPTNQKLALSKKKKVDQSKRCQTQTDISTHQILSISPRQKNKNTIFTKVQSTTNNKDIIKKGKFNKFVYRKSQQIKFEKSPVRFNTEMTQLSISHRRVKNHKKSTHNTTELYDRSKNAMKKPEKSCKQIISKLNS